MGESLLLHAVFEVDVGRTLQAGQKNGSIRGDVEPRYLASMLRGLLDRTVEWYQKGGSLGPAELADSFCEIYLFGHRGVRAESALATGGRLPNADRAVLLPHVWESLSFSRQ